MINVENFGAAAPAARRRRAQGRPARSRSTRGWARPTRPSTKKELRNVGPSISYKLRDAAGQAREFHNYMLPVDMGDGVPVFLLGVRDTPAEAFRYLRMPADDQGGMDGFVRLRAALADAGAARGGGAPLCRAGHRPGRPELAQQLAASAIARAGAVRRQPSAPAGRQAGARGLQAISDFMEANVPEAERAAGRRGAGAHPERRAVRAGAADARAAPALQPLEPDEKTQAFMTQAVLALSDAQLYPAPMAFELKDFKQVQASVFQVTRAPGKLHGLPGLRLADPRRICDAVRARAPALGLAGAGDGRHGAAARTMALSTNRKTHGRRPRIRPRCKRRTCSESRHEHRHDHRATTTTSTLQRGLLRRAAAAFDWLFAALVVAGGLFAFARYGSYMDVYEKGILLGAVPAAIWLGWFWRPLRVLMLVGGGVLAAGHRVRTRATWRGPTTVFWLKYFLSSQSAILWMSVLFFMSTIFYWIGMFARGAGATPWSCSARAWPGRPWAWR